MSSRDITEYEKLIAGKIRAVEASGFEPGPFTVPLFEWQKPVVAWGIRRGRCAFFQGCGLGKTAQQIEWAKQVADHTGKPVMILCPLAVAEQTVAEGVKFGVTVNHCREASDIKPGVNITNNDRLHLFDAVDFGGVVIDESSCLKSFTGKMRKAITERFKSTPYRLCCTATPAPNDFTELGQHAEFLGICSPAEMLATYFINDTFDTGTWRLKGHSVEIFWRWVSTWAAAISRPSDIGFSDEGYDLPEVNTHIITVNVCHKAEEGSGELFRNVNASATNLHAELRRTMEDRVKAAVEIVNGNDHQWVVWCEGNDESKLLASLIDGAVEVTGSDSMEVKEKRIHQFIAGEARVMVTKCKLAGFGLNLQFCSHEIYTGRSFSYEQIYQAGKRMHRFGQTKNVQRYIIQTDTDDGVAAALLRKQTQHEEMQELMKFTRDVLNGESTITFMNTDIKTAKGDGWTLSHGDCVRVAKTMDDNSIDFSIHSPPFASLFTYSADSQDMGNCNNMAEFMVQYGFLIDELHRITLPGRLCAVHCVDLLSTKWKDGEIEFQDFSGEIKRAFRSRGWLLHSPVTIWKDPVTEMQRTKAHGLLYKTLKSDSSRSRVGAAEYLLVFRKRGENPKPITHTPDELPLDEWQKLASPVWMNIDQGRVLNGRGASEHADERHVCPLQLGIIENALKLWSSPGDLVFSPFTGIGSEGYCSLQMGRKFVGAELKESYFKTACANLESATAQRTLF